MILLFVVIAIILITWIGLRIQPTSFPTLTASSRSANTISLPDTLPAPVKKFYSQIYESEIPEIESAIISGRGTIRIKGIPFPARFRFYHNAGQSYRHTIELTFFGIPIMNVEEYYKDGNARLELPFGTIENEPKVNQGANLALWGEAIWFPSIFISDSRVQWKAVDSDTAILNVPFGQSYQQIIVRFDPESGQPQLLEAMRYKQADDTAKTLWLVETKNWRPINGHTLCSVGNVFLRPVIQLPAVSAGPRTGATPVYWESAPSSRPVRR